MTTSQNIPALASLPRPFGRYVLFDRIGVGGMAEIYLARQRLSLEGGRLVVVKQILPELSEDESFTRMFVAEAKLAAQLRHANVVQVLELGREEGRLFIAMEYVEGFDLNELLRRFSRGRIPLPAEFAIFIMREVLAALSYAHRARSEKGRPLGIVHRDVTPSNVLVSFEGEVKLCDFGIARAASASAGAADGLEGARFAGKSAYMSPEHARGESIGQAADLFSAGVLLWEMCAGRRLYKGSEEEMLALARGAKIPPLPDRGLPAHDRLQALLDKALQPQPGDRFDSAADMLAALDQYAMEARLIASPLRFGSFLTEHFAEEILAMRRLREEAAARLEATMPPPRFTDDDGPTQLQLSSEERVDQTPTPTPTPSVTATDAVTTRLPREVEAPMMRGRADDRAMGMPALAGAQGGVFVVAQPSPVWVQALGYVAIGSLIGSLATLAYLIMR